MADAILPLVDDGASSLFYNPAGLASIKGFGAELLNMTLEANSDFVGGVDLNAYKVTGLSSYAPTLSATEYPGVGYSFFPNFSARGFAFGILMQDRVAATNDNGQVSYRSSYRFIPTLGTGVKLAGGMFRLGYSLQYVNQAQGQVTNIPITSSPLGYHQQLSTGSGLSHTVGATIALPIAWLPTISTVVRNIGTTKFTDFTMIPLGSNSSGLPATEAMTVDAALGLQPRFGGNGSMNWVFQLKDVTNTSGFSITDRFTVGTEFAIRNLMSVRLGYGLGSGLDGLNAGIGLKGPKADFHLSWYREELGTPSAPARERRWMMQYQVRAF